MSIVKAIDTVIIDGPEKNKGLFEFIGQYFVDLKDTFSQKGYAYNVFEKNLFFLKAFGLIAIVMLAVVNYSLTKNAGLISSNPGTFLKESILFGLGGMFPFLILCYLRNNVFTQKEIVMMSIVIFFLFFVLNYLLELSGFYAWSFGDDENMYDEKDENNTFEKTVSRTSEIMVALVMIGSLLALVFSSLFVMDVNPTYNVSMSPVVVFLMETILFSVISAIPVYIIASNRNDLSSKTTYEFIIIFVKFAVLHFVLQLSGFYKHVFNPK